MTEQLGIQEMGTIAEADVAAGSLGRVTVLEALAEETTAISVDAQGRCTPAGNGVDFDD